jgi:hypothetical protein
VKCNVVVVGKASTHNSSFVSSVMLPFMKNDFVSSCVNYFASSDRFICDVGASEVVAESLGVTLSLLGVTAELLLTTSALLK